MTCIFWICESLEPRGHNCSCLKATKPALVDATCEYPGLDPQSNFTYLVTGLQFHTSNPPCSEVLVIFVIFHNFHCASRLHLSHDLCPLVPRGDEVGLLAKVVCIVWVIVDLWHFGLTQSQRHARCRSLLDSTPVALLENALCVQYHVTEIY